MSGTAMALHYAPDGSLRWVRGAQLGDVMRVAPLNLPTAAQAFAAGQVAAASWPGFSPGDPGSWAATTLADLLSHAELSLLPEGSGALRPVWAVSTYDASGAVFRLSVDGSTGALLSVSPGGQQGIGGGQQQYVDCSPDGPTTVAARVKAQNDIVWDGELRPTPAEDVNAYPHAEQNETNCGPNGDTVPCTHEAVWQGIPNAYPQVEVYHGRSSGTLCQSPTHANKSGNYMKVGIKVVGTHPTYDNYGSTDTYYLYRNYAGDAMLFTRRTMEVFHDYFGRCGFDGVCGTARVVVLPVGCLPDYIEFWYSDAYTPFYPANVIKVCSSSNPPNLPTMGAAQDIVAHEWGHGVSKHSPADFYGQCTTPPVSVDACEMAEGFADVVGHAVEWLTQSDPTPSRTWETRDWISGEDWNPTSPMLRRADEYDTRSCNELLPADRYRYSVHREDTLMCEGTSSTTWHSAGNRLAVVLSLLAEGGTNPGCNHFGNCDVVVQGIGLEAASRILFRVLDTQADGWTDRWSLLPYLALDAAYDLYHDVDPGDPCAFGIQVATRTAFAAVGYPDPQWWPEPQLNCPLPCPPVCCNCPPCCDE